MPFTFAHPSVVLPLIKFRRLSWTALVIGSMAPDFEYFLRLRLRGEYGHTWWGILYFDVPLTILLGICFHQVVKPPLFRSLPGYLKERWWKYAGISWWDYLKKYWYLVIPAAAFGAFTHVVWDSFTHNSTWPVRSLPFLKTQISLYFEEYPLYHLLQHASSVIGLFFVVRFIYKMPAEQTVSPEKLRSYWPIVTVLLIVISGVTLFLMSRDGLIKIGHVIVIGLGGLMYSLVITGIYFQVKSRHVRGPQDRTSL